jgi:hypothetical protein
VPRWYWWIAGVIALRVIGENVSLAAAFVLGPALLLGYWGYRLGTAPGVGESRARAAWRELRRIGLEVGDAVLGWTLLLLLILAIAGLIATWPPGWVAITLVVILAIALPVALIASVLGVSSVLDRLRMRKWSALLEQLEPVLDGWERHSLSTRPADRLLVERLVSEVYARRRGLEPPVVHWAESPPAFIRLLAAAEDRPRLHKPPPSWFSLVRFGDGHWTWHSIWAVAAGGADDGAWENPPTSETEAGLAAGVGMDGLVHLVEETPCFAFRTGVAIVLDRPTAIHRHDSELHNPSGPAVVFPDGWRGWALEGVPVPAEAIEHPDRFDPRIALTHRNVEVRRVLLAHLGWDRVISASGMTPHAQDEHGRLWQLPVPDDEPVLLLEVENATPDADGTHRSYFLRVPPDMSTPREATAWTFGLSELEYAPDAES